MDYIFVSLLAGIVGFIFGIGYGKYLLLKQALYSMSDKELSDLEKMVKSLEEEDVETSKILKSEVINGVIYLYDSNDNFICQGNTIEEVARRYGEIDSGEVTIQFTGDNNYIISAGKVVA